MSTKTKQVTLLAIFFSIGLVFYLRSNTGLAGALAQERILASGTYTTTIGGYTIADSSKVTDACGTTDVRDALTDAATATKQADLDKSFWSYGRSYIKAYLKDSKTSDLQSYIQANVAVFAGPAIFCVISMLCCIFQFIWILTFSYCRPDDPEKGCCRGKCCQKLACWSTMILPIFVFIFTIGWIISMGTMIDSLDSTKCGVASIMNDIKNGVNYVSGSGTYSQFSGMKGYVYVFEEFLSNMDAQKTHTNGYQIAAQGLNTKATTAYDTLASYYNAYSSSTVTSPSDGSTSITPDSVTNLVSTISTDIGTEYTTLKTYATKANTMGSTVYGVSNGHASGTANYNTLSSGVTGAATSFNSIYSTLDGMNIKTDSMTDYKELMKFVTYGIGIGVLALTIWFWISLIFTHKLHKCKCCCECFGKIALMLKSIFALLFCILGIVFVIAAGLTVNICYFQYQLYNDTSFYAEIKPTETTFQSFLNACAFTTSTQLLTDFLSTEQADSFNQLTDIYDGVYGLGQVKSTYYDTSLTSPIKMKTYYEALASYADFSADDYSSLSSDTHKYTTV